jgi:phosphatidylinositol alpha 1,6-mannosyltransferase
MLKKERAAHLLRRGHAVLVLCPGAPGRPLALRPAVKVVRVPSVPLPVWSEYRLTWGLGRSAVRALTNFSPSIVHVAVRRRLP